MATRTTHRSTAGTKLLAKRKSGKFTDIQTHRRSSRADQRQTTVEEATRVLVRACRGWLSGWKLGGVWAADHARLQFAINAFNTATRAAAKRKRARSVKP